MILFSRNLKEKNLDCQVQVQQAGMTGFEPAISALTGPHVSRYTTSPFRFCVPDFFVSVSLNVQYFSIPFIPCQVILKICDFLLHCIFCLV